MKDEECKAVEYTLSESLYGKVDPKAAVISILSTQVEITMAKSDVTIHWPSLQKSDVKVLLPISQCVKYTIFGVTSPTYRLKQKHCRLALQAPLSG